MRAGWGNRNQGRIAQDLQTRVGQLDRQGKLPTRTVTNLKAVLDTETNSAQISFTLVSTLGLDSVVLLRNTTRDPGAAKALQSWPYQSLGAMGANAVITFSDSDPAIIGKVAYYWLQIVPAASSQDSWYLVGPQSVDQSFVGRGTPAQVLDFDAGHAAGSGGFVLVSVDVSPPGDRSFSSVKIYVTGYQGNANAVAIAQQASTGFSFLMQQTGETVTLAAVAVSVVGTEAPLAGAPTKALALNGGATVAPKPMSVTATELSTGVQIGFPASPDTTVTKYLVYRNTRGGGFGGATQIGFVNASGASSYTYLDTAGLGGSYEWYVVAQNPTGNSPNSVATSTTSFATSADLPPNVPLNTTNLATVDSIDAGSDVTVRIYGTGGVGSTWTRPAGFGTQTYAYGTILHLAYSTTYWIVWTGSQYQAYTAFVSTLPDGYVWAGKVTTVAAGNVGGTSGGGGSTGGSGGRLMLN